MINCDQYDYDLHYCYERITVKPSKQQGGGHSFKLPTLAAPRLSSPMPTLPSQSRDYAAQPARVEVISGLSVSIIVDLLDFRKLASTCRWMKISLTLIVVHIWNVWYCCTVHSINCIQYICLGKLWYFVGIIVIRLDKLLISYRNSKQSQYFWFFIWFISVVRWAILFVISEFMLLFNVSFMELYCIYSDSQYHESL